MSLSHSPSLNVSIFPLCLFVFIIASPPSPCLISLRALYLKVTCRINWGKEATSVCARIADEVKCADDDGQACPDRVALVGKDTQNVEEEEEEDADGPAKPVSLPRRGRTRVLLLRGAVFAVSLALVLAGVILAMTAPETHLCYPLPPVANATGSCNGFVSLRGGDSCYAHCDLGFRSNGTFSCAANGTLLSVPTCERA